MTPSSSKLVGVSGVTLILAKLYHHMIISESGHPAGKKFDGKQERERGPTRRNNNRAQYSLSLRVAVLRTIITRSLSLRDSRRRLSEETRVRKGNDSTTQQ